MISPADQKVIQIDITNACPHKCANCTRFNGHHKKPFFMEVDQVKKAIASLEGYQGMVGIMGGEPTLHPDFAGIAAHVQKVVPENIKPHKRRYQPLEDFGKYRNANLASMKRKRGLWTSLGKKYYEHYELIQNTFSYQCINDHAHNGRHMALLLSRKELGIPDEDWFMYRNNCWLQREWSGSITPKGAFFCEVAGALDMLFDGPGGWPVEPGWWKRKPKDFGSQLEWCELCSACLPVPSRVAASGIDDVSPGILERLKAIDSPKVRQGKVHVFDCAGYDAQKYAVNKACEPYLDEATGNACRVSTNSTIRPQRIDAITVCVGYDDYLEATIRHTLSQVDSYTIVTTPEDKATKTLAKSLGCKVVLSDLIKEGGAAFAKGRGMNDGLGTLRETADWILVLDADVILPETFRASIDSFTLNPGALYYTKRWGPADPAQLPKFLDALEGGATWHDLFWQFGNKQRARKTDRLGNDIEHFPYGYFQLFSPRASALQNRKKLYPEESKTAEYDDMNFAYQVYPADRRVSLPVPECDVIHLPHGAFKHNWSGRKSPRLERTDNHASTSLPGK